MKLLLHACCGPCSLEPTRILRASGYDLTLYYANSNIAPDGEYARRLATLRTWADDAQVPVAEGLRAPKSWEVAVGRKGDGALAAVDANEEFPALAIDPAQRKARCRACYRLRFEETALAAVAQDFDAISTTLSVSPYQYTDIIHDELSRAAARFGISAVFEDFRPCYDEATRRSRSLGMYRQNYCGCRFSAAEAAAERELHKRERAKMREREHASHAGERAAAETARIAKKTERAAYAAKQAKKHVVLKALREQERAQQKS